MRDARLTVLKFGGSVLADDGSLPAAVGEIERYLAEGSKVIAVVSAHGDETDRLLARARRIARQPDEEALAALLATGEGRSCAALVLAAVASGLSAVTADARRLALTTVGPLLEARPRRLARRAVERLLSGHDLLVVPGFVGVDSRGRSSLLGRGGSDMTAIFLAARLAAERCILVKDVDGWFVEDPREAGGSCPRFARLSWDDAAADGAPIVQPRAVALARDLGRGFEVRAIGSSAGTLVGSDATRVEAPSGSAREPAMALPAIRPLLPEPTIETRLVQRPRVPGEPTGASSTPIYQTATFALDGDGGWDYSRSGNPTRDVLESQLAVLDGAERALAYSSGMAAVGAVLRCVEPGAEIAVGRDLYGGTLRLLESLAGELRLTVRFVDTSDPERLASQLTAGTDLIWLETPTNPRLETCDLAAVAAVARRVDALVAVDNSMLSPLYQRPLALGADFAVQSATKSLGGHSDLTAGVVSVLRDDLAERLAFRRNSEGNALAPFDCWLLLRGLETLAVRLPRQVANCGRLAAALARNRSILRLYSAPRCAVLSFELADGAAARRFADASRLFRTTVSFGGVTSSVDLPSEMSHASVPERWRQVQALPEGLVRLAVGIEDADDLMADLGAALEAATAPRARRVLA